MLYQLVNAIVSTDGQKAMVFGINVDQNTTTATVIDISTDTAVIKEQKVFNRLIKMVWSESDYWCYIKKDGSGWDSKITQVKSTWDFQEVESRVLDMQLFDFVARISPSQQYLALGTFKEKKVKVFAKETMEVMGTLHVENTFYPNGINFSNDSTRLGYIAFDQGGGRIVYAEKQGNEFVTVFNSPKKQISDDFQMTGCVNFDGEELIATTIYTGETFNIVKYNKSGDELWKTVIKVEAPGITDSEQMNNIIWNQVCRDTIVGDKLFTGAGRKILVHNTKTGEEMDSISCNLPSFVHQIIKVPNSNKLFMVDILGTAALASVQ